MRPARPRVVSMRCRAVAMRSSFASASGGTAASFGYSGATMPSRTSASPRAPSKKIACEMWSSQNSGAHRKNALGIRVIGAPPLSGSPTPRTPHERSLVPWHTELVDADRTFRMLHPAGPAAELVETRRVHRAARAVPQRLPRFLDRARARREHQFTTDAAGVVFERHARAQQRFDDVDAERSDLHLGAFDRRAARTIETVLPHARAGRR